MTSGMHLIEYDFCEVPGSALSGFVYQDGDVILSSSGSLTPSQLLSLRDGQLTGDDTRLAGVVLELRNGITGEPILASQAAPGVYASGPIRTTTDANGFYIFTGLPAGNYAVFQIQPNGYTDHVDTPGTTLGVAINPATGVDPLVLSTLSAGINPNNDAILRIALGVGQHSQLNNFSEVRVELPPPPPEPPRETPPENPITELPPDSFPILYGHENVDTDPLIRFSVFAPGNAYTWHLSVINGGIPRGNQDPLNVADPRWESAIAMNREKWLSADLTQGEWTQGNADDVTDGMARIENRSIFGLPQGIPVSGDFNGDGVDEIAVYQEGDWYIDLNGNRRWDQEDLWAQLGSAADRPVTGDWDGDGKDDIGIYGPIWVRDPRAIEADPGLPDPDNPRFRDPKNLPPRLEDATSGIRTLKLTADGSEREDLIDHVFAYGQPEDIPVAGDWNGDGIRTIGVFRGGVWELDLDGDGRWTSADGSFSFGTAGDVPVVGDWNGDGIEEIGIFRGGTWILDIDGDRELEATDKVFELGGAGDKPVAGDWNGDGIDDPAVYRGMSSGATQLPGPLREAG
ncbi:MAG: hypothetical protein R3B96_06675 [Pirellulaceae bacterium]